MLAVTCEDTSALDPRLHSTFEEYDVLVILKHTEVTLGAQSPMARWIATASPMTGRSCGVKSADLSLWHAIA